MAPRRTFQPEQDVAALDDTSFLHYLATVPTVTVDEGLRGVLILSTPEGDFPTFDDRLAELTRQGAIKTRWGLEPDQTLDHGTLAYLLRVLCRTPTSLSAILVLPMGLGDRRYALKTCIDEGLLPYALPNEPVSGGEFVAVLSRAEARIQIPKAGSAP